MKTYGDFFTGFGGMTIGAKAAGLDVQFGVEYSAAIANVYRQNLGDHIHVADVTTIDPAELPGVDVFHASPPCTNASVANANGGESAFDLAMAQAVCRYISHHKPQVFTMENVYQYRNFESWHEIAKALLNNGYTYNYWHVNMANYGVPQTRRRMIVVARRDGISPSLPEHTHAETPQPGLFGTKKRWVSWHEAIDDIYHMKIKYDISQRLVGKTAHVDNCLLDAQNTGFADDRLTAIDKDAPAFTCSSSKSLSGYLIKENGIYYASIARFITRFQSFPDWYKLPENNSLAMKGIGNAVPPLFAGMLFKTFV